MIAFDVNETLLDLSALDSLFERLFGSAALRAQWFAQMLQLSFVGGLTGRYVDFPSAQRAALTMLAETAGTQLDPEHGERIARQMRRLPPHPDAAPALDRLREAGLTSRRSRTRRPTSRRTSSRMPSSPIVSTASSPPTR